MIIFVLGENVLCISDFNVVGDKYFRNMVFGILVVVF